MKNESGITLTVLVITVIVLSILVGYTVRMSIANNDSIIKYVDEETMYQQNKAIEEENKKNSVISTLEEEWGLN